MISRSYEFHSKLNTVFFLVFDTVEENIIINVFLGWFSKKLRSPISNVATIQANETSNAKTE